MNNPMIILELICLIFLENERGRLQDRKTINNYFMAPKWEKAILFTSKSKRKLFGGMHLFSEMDARGVIE